MASVLLEEKIPLVQLLLKSKPCLFSALFTDPLTGEKATKALIEIAYNLLYKDLPLSTIDRHRLKRRVSVLRQLAAPTFSTRALGQKRKLLSSDRSLVHLLGNVFLNSLANKIEVQPPAAEQPQPQEEDEEPEQYEEIQVSARPSSSSTAAVQQSVKRGSAKRKPVPKINPALWRTYSRESADDDYSPEL